MVSDFNAGRTAAAFLFPPLVSWPRIIKRHSYGVPERFVDNAGSWLAGNYLSVQYLLFADAEIFENMLQNAVRSDSVPGDGAEVGDDLADFFAQKIGRKAVGETFEGFTECLAGR